MFYSHTHLRRNGRFGFIWLAATQSRVLSRREIAAVNISVAVTDILEHVPGQLSKDAYNRPRRFSLYLSSQLMFGTVKVLQKQWDFLLSDLTSLLKKVHPDVPANEIDLIVIKKSDPVTLESCVPTSVKDKHYDPFFGSLKANTADFEALLAAWEDHYVEAEKLRVLSPEPIKLEIGSPNSVSDVRQIQIVDHPNISLSSMVLEQQDLPCLDADQLTLFEEAEKQLDITVEELIHPDIDRIVANQQDLSYPRNQTEEPVLPRPVEETPAVKTAREQPGTPQKPKRRLRNNGEEGTRRNRGDEKDERANKPNEGDLTVRDGQLVEEAQHETAEPQHGEVVQTQHREVAEPEQLNTVPEPQLHLKTPDTRRSLGHDWLEKNPKLMLKPLTPSPSPVRKRRPHTLMIDEDLQLTRDQLRHNMTTSQDTLNTQVLPGRPTKNLFKETGSKISHPPLKKLWSRNCKFGIRVFESDTEASISSQDSPNAWSRKRPASLDEYDTSVKMARSDSMQTSIEKGRDTSATSAINESRERSKSFVDRISDLSTPNVSAEQNQISLDLNASTLAMEGQLMPVPEEHEQSVQLQSPAGNIQPPAVEVPHEIPEINMSPVPHLNDTRDRTMGSPKLLSLVDEKAGEIGNWTTFRTICPPHSTSRMIAIRLFNDLCDQLAKKALKVRQDYPYGEIYIWRPDSMEDI